MLHRTRDRCPKVVPPTAQPRNHAGRSRLGERVALYARCRTDELRLRLCGQDDPGVDVTTGAETARLVAHAGTVSALCQLSDGWLASSSWDNTIRLWDVASGAEGARIEVDALVRAIAALAPKLIVAGDQRWLRWLEVVD